MYRFFVYNYARMNLLYLLWSLLLLLSSSTLIGGGVPGDGGDRAKPGRQDKADLYERALAHSMEWIRCLKIAAAAKAHKDKYTHCGENGICAFKAVLIHPSAEQVECNRFMSNDEAFEIAAQLAIHGESGVYTKYRLLTSMKTTYTPELETLYQALQDDVHKAMVVAVKQELNEKFRTSLDVFVADLDAYRT